jgi:hypothetical protein
MHIGQMKGNMCYRQATHSEKIIVFSRHEIALEADRLHEEFGSRRKVARGLESPSFVSRRFAQFFFGARRSSLIPRAFPDCMNGGDIGCGRGCGKAILRRQGATIHSTDTLRQMRRQRAFDSAFTRSGETGRLRNSGLRMLRVRASNASQREELTRTGTGRRRSRFDGARRLRFPRQRHFLVSLSV